ncbi:DEAD/DEAH box helicase [Roseibacillus persicicus]|uniref:DEAD/DEAH box family ATP-dependent RNA helicase n=1 Tax=Roseibacillus persicicus TaxID=454148 RepID=A0A918TBZ9_9BACT|nr:DEAD/DEAH box helicase [Roseibacillus persicicus]MDQ8192484.1 DEAD/DEAH box helicase [Roseibacillus persicicus]GHC41318.1 DEAD/DEAH box family ATP-dependent RNA helicase [Roseibacillus persicicus]
MSTFQELPLAAPIQRALSERNYVTPSPIQAQSIPILLKGRDLLGCAQTGTGKTAAFSLPILQLLHDEPKPLRRRSPRVLVLTPTRELATQVGKSMETYGQYLNFKHTLIYGGVGQNPQVRAMRDGVDILVACPGRLLDLINQNYIDLSHVEFFVLDEVDRMLDMGFLRDVQKIVSELPKRRQSLFFSATLAPNIVKLAHNILNNPATVTIESKTSTADNVEHSVAFLSSENKKNLLLSLLDEQGEGDLTIIFSRTKHGANKLAKFITQNGFEAEAIHGNRSQAQRDRTLDKFRAGKLPVLVATDVAARGVDVKAVTLVINFDLPQEPEAYVHRIGRTGRADAKGRAVSFCAEDDCALLTDVEKLIKQRIEVKKDHDWHWDSLAGKHAIGKGGGTRANGGGGQRGGGQRGGRGGQGGGGGGGRRNARTASSGGRRRR